MVIEKQKPVNRVARFFSRLGKRNIIIAVAVIAVGVAVCVNWAILANRGDSGYQGYKVSSGMSNTYGNVSAGKDETEVYFAMRLSRSFSRSSTTSRRTKRVRTPHTTASRGSRRIWRMRLT